VAQGSRSPGKVCLCFNWEIGAMREPVGRERERWRSSLKQMKARPNTLDACECRSIIIQLISVSLLPDTPLYRPILFLSAVCLSPLSLCNLQSVIICHLCHYHHRHRLVTPLPLSELHPLPAISGHDGQNKTICRPANNKQSRNVTWALDDR